MDCSWECRLCWHQWHAVQDGREREWEWFFRASHSSMLYDSLGVPMPKLCVSVCGDTGTDPSLSKCRRMVGLLLPPTSISRLLDHSFFLLVSPHTALHGPLWREAMICFSVWYFFFYASSALLTYFILIPWYDFNRLYARGGEEGCLWVWGGRKERLKDRDTVQGR